MMWTPDKIDTYLVKVRDALVSGEIKEAQFDMNHIAERVELGPCGSLGCMGGWMVMYEYNDRVGKWPDDWILDFGCSPLSKMVWSYPDGDPRATGLHNLFFNWPSEGHVTLEMAINAINAFRGGNNTPWSA